MKKFIFPLAAAAALFSGNLFAQEATMSNLSKEASSADAYTCVKSVTEHNKTLGVQGGVVAQEFTACTSGTLKLVELKVKNASENAVYLAQLVDYRGEVLDYTRFSKNDLNDQALKLNLSGRMIEGKTYSLHIAAPEGKPIAFRYLQGPMGTLWNDGDPVRGTLAGTFGFAGMPELEGISDKDRGTAAPETRGLANQCKVAVNGHDGRVRLNGLGNGTTQSFEACSAGTLEHISVKVQSSFEDYEGRFYVKTMTGETLFNRNINARDIVNGTLNVPLNIRVYSGEQLNFGIKALGDHRIALHSNSNGDAGICKMNGAVVDANLEFTAFIAEANTDATPRSESVDTKVTTYPNPFVNQISVRLENAKEGKAIVQLLDFSGNVLRSDMIFVKNTEGQITFETRDIERPGYYALRVIQGDDVKNITIMKR
jgi:hypothetical protein